MTFSATFAQQSYIGDREMNEDRAAVVERPDDATLVMVADGLGGHAGGEIASQALIDAISETFLSLSKEQLENPKSFMHLAVSYAHKYIHRRAAEEGLLDYVPKTTCVIALVHGSQIIWCHVGDSRLYIVRDDMIVFHTSDHIAKGYSKNAPINRCVGGVERPLPAISEPMELEENDLVFLCSDGAWKNLEIEDLNAIDKSFPQPDLDILLRKLERRNSYPSDNVSAALVCWGDFSSTKKTDTSDPKSNISIKPKSKTVNAEVDEEIDETINKIEKLIGGITT